VAVVPLLILRYFSCLDKLAYENILAEMLLAAGLSGFRFQANLLD
jgi:hypothetical protein